VKTGALNGVRQLVLEFIMFNLYGIFQANFRLGVYPKKYIASNETIENTHTHRSVCLTSFSLDITAS
jgi:hypothetical protein